MLNIGKNNIFLVRKSPTNLVSVSKVLDFYDVVGYNIIYFYDNDSPIYNGIVSKIKYSDPSRLPDIILNNSFRVTLIVIDTIDGFFSIGSIRKVTDIPIIVLSRGKGDNIIDFIESDSIYEFFMEDKNSMVRSITNCWSSRLDDIKKSRFRSSKIDDILRK